MDGVPATLESLTIRGCPELKSIPHGLCHSTSLLRLSIDYSAQLQSGELPSLSENSASLPSTQQAWLRNLPSLQESKMEYFPQLQLLPDHQDGFPPALASLSIRSCPNLTSLPKALHNLISLTYLDVDHCPQLVSFPEEGLPPMLTKLCTNFCPNLRYLPKDLYNLISLRALLIWDCPHLEARPDDRLPPNLERLYFRGCPKLEQQLEEEDRKDWLDLMIH